MKDIKNYRFCRGFTLAELLTVVIIVAVLALIGFGYYKKSVEQAYFSEGLSIASLLVESINRNHDEELLEGNVYNGKRKLKTLDMLYNTTWQNCATSSDYCKATKYFEITTDADEDHGSIVRAYRGTKTDYRYYLELTTNFGSPKNRIACVGSPGGIYADFDAEAFCQSIGYTQCTEDHICTQP